MKVPVVPVPSVNRFPSIMTNFYSDRDPKVGRGYDALMLKIFAQFGYELGERLDVTLYRDYALKQQAILDVPEQGKCDRKAAQLRQEGNRLYVKKKLDEALLKYNESICFAEAGSDQLGMGFANRSAVYFEQGEYEFALANIVLAKRHKYPENLMPKLVAREHNCRDKLESSDKKDKPFHRLAINVNVNAKIPFVADGITMKLYNDEQGRGLVAEKDFQAGAVIMDEKAVLSFTNLDAHYSNCGHCCKKLTYNLIPCPGCVSFLYCSEECLQDDERFTHRFECAIADKIRNVMHHSAMIGPKQFFYGLSLFGDDIQAMMDYCKAAKGVGNPFELDFRKNDLLEQFKVMHKAGVHHITGVDYTYRVSAAAFYVVYMKHPLVAKIVRTKAQQDFMLHTFLMYIRNCYTLLMTNRTPVTVSVLPFVGALCNHSCDPNVVFSIGYGRYLLVVLRPIRKGEQIVSSYGPTWWQPVPDYKCTYTCRCPVCTKTNWTLKEVKLTQAASKHLLLMSAATVSETAFNNADQLNMAQQFVNRYAANYHPSEVFGAALRIYRRFLMNALEYAEKKLEKVRALAIWEASDDS